MAAANAAQLIISTPGGPVAVDVPHVAPGGSLVSADAPKPPGFRPPTIFSAPVPSGSGARALGLAGAFTAVADDATAASWNPAGLLQLESPEASMVLRASRERDEHHSSDPGFSVGRDDFDAFGLNYASAVYPFQLAGRNFVASANLQETYDFTQQFHADLSDAAQSTDNRLESATFRKTVSQHVEQGIVELDVTSRLMTRKTSALTQLLDSDLVSDLAFDQQGIVYAATPALAVELTPKFAIGAALNLYQDGPLGGQGIRSSTRAHYEGTSTSRNGAKDTATTSGDYTYTGVAHFPSGGGIPVPVDVPFAGSGAIAPFTDVSSGASRDTVIVDGTYEEINRFENFDGLNATLGAMWSVSRHLSLGATVDLPWTAHAAQRKTVRNTATTYNGDRSRVLSVSSTEDVGTKDVEFTFPLRWAAGALWRWSDILYTSLDISQTRWSDFSFKAEGEPRLNPLDGSPRGEHDVDDCWTVSGGMEYLLLFRTTEVPLRAGVSWEQRPALERPDEFWHFTLGSGISMGRGPGKVILDIAYEYAFGHDVQGSLVPGRDVKSNVQEHQLFVSLIKHL